MNEYSTSSNEIRTRHLEPEQPTGQQASRRSKTRLAGRPAPAQIALGMTMTVAAVDQDEKTTLIALIM